MTQHYHDDVSTKQTRRQRPNEISSIMMIGMKKSKNDEFDSIMMMRAAS